MLYSVELGGLCLEGQTGLEPAPQGFAVPRIIRFAIAPHLAAHHGFEPQYPESESGVLPLDE